MIAWGLTAGAVWPAAADAHGLVGRAYLPVPPWLFAWAAGAVLVVSFVVLPRLWSTPKLERAPERRLLGLPAWLDPLCGALGLAAFVIVVVSGVTGSQIPTANLVAHHFSLLRTQGQATAYLISDPMGTGSNLFGTAGVRIDYGLVSAALIWYVQVGALVSGHVSGPALAHDRALVVYGDSHPAADSQRWMLVVMVSFTCLGLWLLSAVNT